MSNQVEVFNEQQAQEVVDQILKGYRDYIDERFAKKKSMKISSAYAWVKANHLDNALANLSFINRFTPQRAGYSWGYLEFDIDTKEFGKSVFIVKGSRRLKQVFENGKKNESKYLLNYSVLNDDYVEKHLKSDESILPQTIQFELLSPEELKMMNPNLSAYNNFLIITHEVNEENNINAIQVVMTDSDRNVYSLQDLSAYIATSTITFNDEKYSDLTNLSNDIFEFEEFGYVPKTEVQEQQ
ncbi:hypothetical protein SMU40_04000 [Streptococcus mutans 15VF2]|uniref:spr1630 family ClpXP-sensitive toxin n=2 Tax=Streptococcus mutans TaxID=1309 RepID=UPI0002B5D241|nr:hypothetical protein [Streptococcus mutans]EMB74477.1 hypothetical protein SMU40_04000 [Streptococcus mutans 15VF2]MCB5086614.1 hypothetical protein [Streptococcus mutans]